MAVPAHSHGTQHDPYWNGTDTYEDYMSAQSHWSQYNWQSALVSFGPGGLINLDNGGTNPVKYLFYLTQQYANRFSDDHRPGNLDYYQYDPSTGANYGMYLNPFYAHVSQTPFYIPQCCPSDVARYCFPFAIRTVASLMYWFSINTDQFPPVPPSNPTISINLPGSLNLGYDLYRGQTASITVNVQQGTHLSKLWHVYKCLDNIPITFPYSSNGIHTVTGNNQFNLKIQNSNYINEYCPEDNAPTNLYLRAKLKIWNTSGTVWSPEVKLYPKQTIQTGGCPFIYIYTKDSTNNNLYVGENNILHRSEFADYVLQNIKDVYLLRNKPDTIDNQFSIQFAETEYDHSYFDKVKLIAVDHPVGTKIGVTEAKDIVMYDEASITSTDGAFLNKNSDITNNIQYYYQGAKIIQGEQGNGIYAHYDTSAQNRALNIIKSKYPNNFMRGSVDSLALVADLSRNPFITPVVKSDAGEIIITTKNDVYSRSFSRRENLSTVIIPFSTINDAVDNIDVYWNEDFSVNYFSVVPITYSGFDIFELPLASAIHTTWGDVAQFIDSIDNINAEMDTSAIIDMRFSNIAPPQSGMVRDYIIEVNGRYITPGSLDNRGPFTNAETEKNPTTNSYKYKLYLNYPNPFNPSTIIKYDLAKSSKVSLKIYNLLGQVVAELVNTFQGAGQYEVNFNAETLASGVYIYRLEAGDFKESKKMVLMK